MSTYYVIMPVRNVEKSIKDVMDSLIYQTKPPAKIIAINNGSTDCTAEILKSYNVEVKSLDSKMRDYTRIVSLWNMCVGKSYEKYDYHMTMVGDAILEKKYAETILDMMEEDPSLAVVSGDAHNSRVSEPRGAGRFVRQNFFYEYYNKYPEIVGYESEILFKAIPHGYKTKVCHDVTFQHTDDLGGKHNFINFSRGMKALGYHPLYVLGRVVKEVVQSGDIGRRDALTILMSYLRYRPGKTGYFSQFPDETRNEIRGLQKKKIMNKLRW